MTLLCFGYRMAVTVIQRGIRGFFSQIVGFVCRFVFSERIARWIADQGGWVSRDVVMVLCPPVVLLFLQYFDAVDWVTELSSSH